MFGPIQIEAPRKVIRGMRGRRPIIEWEIEMLGRERMIQEEVIPWCAENIGSPVCGTRYRCCLGNTMVFGDYADAMLCYLRFA